MSNDHIATLLVDTKSVVDGEFTSVDRVIDTLLDLRALAASNQALVELIDDTLGSMPGRSIVPNTWWLESLDAIGDSAIRGR